MLYFLLRIFRLFLPYGLILLFYKHNNALPANIRTRSGRLLKAIMLSENYGIIVSKSVYVDNRAKILMEKQRRINEANEALAKEFNTLSFDLKEELFSKPEVQE